MMWFALLALIQPQRNRLIIFRKSCILSLIELRSGELQDLTLSACALEESRADYVGRAVVGAGSNYAANIRRKPILHFP